MQIARIVYATVLLLCMFVSAKSASARPLATVLVNREVVTDPESLPKLTTTLGAAQIANADKNQFIEALQRSDIVYVNTHVYGATRHLIDKGLGRGGSILVGTVGTITGAGSSDLVYQSDVKTALSARSPRLVIIAGCSADAYRWDKAFPRATVIDFASPIAGRVADVFFKHFFTAFVNQGKTVSESVDYAKSQTPIDPEHTSGAFRVWLTDLIANLRVYGPDDLKYSDMSGYNLNGLWSAAGYQTVQVQQLKIQQNGNELKAIKVTGNKYVPAGRTSWQATMNGTASFSGMAQWADEGYVNPQWVPVQIKIENENTISVISNDSHYRSLKMTRIK